ncbi:MAG: sulfatase-like hydrolase/transferase, partial [Duncaniella sp.]|nr:sulfatase-like hydrolase/transferase [Duncaniella sp.]
MNLTFVLFALLYFGCATAWFALVQKPLFAALNMGCSADRVGLPEMRRVYANGVYSDCIIAAYLTAIPLILGCLRTFIPGMNLGLCVGVYNAVIAIAVGLITVSDAVLYRYWQYKLDSSVFVYLRNPKGAFASVSTAYLAGALVIVALFCVGFFAFVTLPARLCAGLFPDAAPGVAGGVLIPVLTILLLGVLFIITRGLRIRPNNPSIAYFSPNPFLNHWALNPAFNLLYSLSTKDDYEGKFQRFDPTEAERITAPIFPTSGTPQTEILNTKRPNILLIVWESLGAEFVESLGGRKNVTPNLDRIAAEGVMFAGCTAGSFRTDRGLVCLLSGIPGQPTTSLIRYTRKLPGLPALPRRLRELGYRTTAVHGGDLSIMHKADYYLASGHDRLISENELPHGLDKGKWGVHDGPVFDILP